MIKVGDTSRIRDSHRSLGKQRGGGTEVLMSSGKDMSFAKGKEYLAMAPMPLSPENSE